MGLDCYLYEADPDKITAAYGFSCWDYDRGEPIGTEIAYWRKHFALDGWMMSLMHEKSGHVFPLPDPESVVIDLDDLNRLEACIIKASDEDWGRWSDELNGPSPDREDDLAIIAKARQSIANKKTIYYYASR